LFLALYASEFNFFPVLVDDFEHELFY
jgi:hypothetical protein